MKGFGIKRTVAAIAAVFLSMQCAFGNADFLCSDKPKAVENFENAYVTNQGSAKGDAVIRGKNASVTYDSSIKSDVLNIGGDSFGDGWLQLPSMFENVKDGFSFSMDFSLDSGAEDYTRLFQFSSIPFGTGAVPSYNSPDISVDLNDKKNYRTSIFAGNSQKTADDKAHRSIFTLDATPDSGKWHTLCISYSPETVGFYIDGKAVTYEADENLQKTLKNLFSGNLLSSYKYNSVGHSVYTDNDVKASIDNVAFYDYALTASQAASLPDDPAYLYTFESDTLKENSTALQENSASLGDKPLTSIPALQISSPDNAVTTKFWSDGDGSIYYSVERDGSTVIQPSKLGLVTTDEDLSSGFSAKNISPAFTYCDEEYTMPNGKHCRIRNNYNEIVFPLVKKDSVLTVIARVYNDGMGFRYALNHSAQIKEEKSEIVLPEKGTLWGSGPNATYEWEINEFSVAGITDKWADFSVPLMGNINDKYWVLISEANVINEETPYCANYLRTTGGSRALSWRTGIKVEEVKMSGSFHTPWRAAIVTDSLNDMSSSDLILNLNPESVIEDTSWIKPGKVAWSWWSSGGDSPIEYHTQKDYIDFAADNGWEHVCLDFGWALWDDSEEKVRELCEYGAKKGIGIFLWYGVNNKGHSGYKDSAGNPAYPYYSLLDEETIVREFKRIKGLGVSGVKVDYYESDTQETMKQMYLCANQAAENKLMVLFHGCTMPRGESRTYPNVISYEAINGTEFYKWFESPSLTNRITYTYLRNTVGSADFTPTGVPVSGIAATAGFAIADTVNIESGVQHFAQSVYTYEGNTALPFLNDVPVKWDEMRVVDGYPMKFNVTARRSGSDWYVGASTIDKRTIEIPLDKLISDSGTYNAYIFGDNENGSKLKVTVLDNLKKDSVIKQELLPNGGCAIKITKSSMKLTTPYSDYRFYEAEEASLSGKAEITKGKYCSNNAFVGFVGGAGNTVSFDNVEVEKAGEYKLRIYYISGERRSLQVGVNGSHVTTLDGLFANRNDWQGICAVNTTVNLNAGKNTITLYNDNGNAPSIDRIAIEVPSENKITYGDIDSDGDIDIFDVIAEKHFMIYGSDDETVKLAADFNQNGKVEPGDLISLKNFVLLQ